MRWISHIAIAASTCAVLNPFAVPAAVLGSTAPDWLEWVINAVHRRGKVKHRGLTHYAAGWLALAAFGAFVWDWRGYVQWFAWGGFVHWVCDALTITGAPVGPWSDRRVTLFGGRVRTGSPLEYVIAGLWVTACGVLIWSKAVDHGFTPYFMGWPSLYENGLIDGAEWRAKRWELL